MTAAPAAFALNTGADLGLSLKPIAGGMAGAAYTRPLEVSAALSGNPATLTQFKGYHFSAALALLNPEVVNFQSRAGYKHRSRSQAQDFVLPDLALSGEILPDLIIGAGLGVDSGLASDFRKHPINAGAGLGLGGSGPGGAITLPLAVELWSANATLGAAYAVTPDLSVGAALSVGYGSAQLGTRGETTGLALFPGNFGDTTAKVHDVSVRGAFGLTYRPAAGITASAAFKSPLEYRYANLLATTVDGSPRKQSVKVEQPLEVSWGVAAELSPQWLVEADAVWKNWSRASLYEAVCKDQFLALLGTQYTLGDWQVRGGYSYATEILRDSPLGTTGGLRGFGTLLLDTAVPGFLARNDLMKVVQTTLAPVVWQHTVTAGLGYAFTRHFRLDGFAAYAFEETASRQTLVLGRYRLEVSEWALGAGANLEF